MQVDLDVVFILDIHFIFLFQNMLRNEDKISIECLFHIIELKESIDQTEDILRIMDGGHN